MGGWRRGREYNEINVLYDYGHERETNVENNAVKSLCVCVVFLVMCEKVAVRKPVSFYPGLQKKGLFHAARAYFQTSLPPRPPGGFFHLPLESIGAPEYQCELLSVMPPPSGSAMNG